jgi:ParB-like chromosome segregation protein Spo0J
MMRKMETDRATKTAPRTSPPPWPADAIERRPVASLIPYARNARTHSAEQVAQIASAIREWGWTVPCLIDEAGGLIAGHGRILAARKLGITEVPVVVARGWTEAQKRSYVIADNKLAMNAGWDDELLRVELNDLTADDLNLSLTGFSNLELRDIVFPVDKKEKNGKGGLSDGLVYQVIVECDDENQQAEILEEFKGRGIQCKPLIL